MRLGTEFVWWCGGLADEGDGPDIRGVYADFDGEEAETPCAQQEHYVFCRSCQRLAPDQNGCRWVTHAELAALLASEET